MCCSWPSRYTHQHSLCSSDLTRDGKYPISTLVTLSGWRSTSVSSGELRGGADLWSAAKACVELVIERVQPAATNAASREPPHNLANCRRGVLDRPSDLLVTDAGVVGCRELARPRPIHRRRQGVFRLVKGCQW